MNDIEISITNVFQTQVKKLKQEGNFDLLLTILREKVKEKEMLDLFERGQPISMWREFFHNENKEDLVAAFLLIADMYDRRDEYNFAVEVPSVTSVEEIRYHHAKIGVYLYFATNFDRDENSYGENFLKDVIPNFQARRFAEGSSTKRQKVQEALDSSVNDEHNNSELDYCGDITKDRLVDVPLYQCTDNQSFPNSSSNGKVFVLIANDMEKNILNKKGNLRNENIALRRIRFAQAGRLFEKAARCYRLSGDSDGENMCYFRLALMYLRGYGVDKSDNFLREAADVQASEYLMKASNNGFGDSEAQYLLGRLKILGRGCIDTNREKSWRDGFTYLINAAEVHWHFLAQYTVGIIYDEALGQDVDTPDKRKECFNLALENYKKAKENSNIPEDFNPSKIRSLCEKRINLINKIIENKLYFHPHFYIYCALLGNDIHDNLQTQALQLSVHTFLKYYSKKDSNRKLPFEEDMNINKTKEITIRLLEGYFPATMSIEARIIQRIIVEEDNKGYDNNGKSTQQRQQEAAIKKIYIRQELNSMRQLKDGEVQWETNDVTELLEAVEVYIKACVALNKPSFEKDPILEFEQRLKVTFSTMHKDDHYSMAKEGSVKIDKDEKYIISWPLHLLEARWNWRECAKQLLEKTKIIWQLYDHDTTNRLPYKIFKIYGMYKKIENFNHRDKRSVSFEEGLEYAPIVLDLIEESGEEEPRIYHHFLSARAVIQRMKEKKRSKSSSINGNNLQLLLEETKFDIRRQAMNSLKAITPVPGVFASIGYHKLIEVNRWEASIIESIEESMTLGKEVRERLHFFINNTIVDRTPFNISWKRSNTNSRNTLNYIIAQSHEVIAAADNDFKNRWSTSTLPIPYLSLPRITSEDPWFHYFHGISKYFEAYNEDAKRIAGEVKCSVEESYETILTEDLFEKKKHFRRLFPDQISFIDSFPRFYSEEDDPSIKSRLLEKFIYFLNTACANWNDDSAINLCFLHLENGIRSRCRDGQNSFLDRYIIETMIKEKDIPIPTSFSSASSSENIEYRKVIQRKLQLEIAYFIQQYKQVFVYMHASRLQNDVESRTATPLYLSQMLRLPFSLAGEYSQVLYSSYANESLNNGDEVLSAEKVIKRFIEGGEITHQSENIILKTTFPPTNLASIGNLLRLHIRPREHPLKDMPPNEGYQYAEFRKDTIPKIASTIPILQLNALITEEILTGEESDGSLDFDGFFSNDIILSSAWASFKVSHRTLENRFFQPYEGSDDSENLFCLAKCMKDACVVRLLEVAGFVSFAGGDEVCERQGMPASHVFYENIPYDWNFCT